MYKGKTYDLTETQLKQIAALMVQEQGARGPEYKGVRAEASLAANLLENNGIYKHYGDDITSFLKYGKWFSRAEYWMNKGSAPNGAIEAVRDVLVNGNRYVPYYVNEHDCFSDITSASNNGKNFTVTDRSKYKKDVTVIKNVYGSVYTFYKFPSNVADPFGYTAAAYNKYNKNNTSTTPSSQTSSGWKAIGTAISTVDDLNYRATPNGKILGKLNTGNRFEVDG